MRNNYSTTFCEVEPIITELGQKAQELISDWIFIQGFFEPLDVGRQVDFILEDWQFAVDQGVHNHQSHLDPPLIIVADLVRHPADQAHCFQLVVLVLQLVV